MRPISMSMVKPTQGQALSSAKAAGGCESVQRRKSPIPGGSGESVAPTPSGRHHPVLALLVVLALAASSAFAGRHKLEIDPETKAGFMLQQIKQERSAAKKVELMIQFADEFPKDDNLPWVLEQLQPAYLEAKMFDKAIAVGDRLLASDPNDIDAANQNLKAAEESKDEELIHKYAKLAWTTADSAMKSAKPANLAQADWDKQIDFCKSVATYAEYAIFALAPKEEGEKRTQVLKWVEEINPKSAYLAGAHQPPSNTLTASAASSAETVKRAQEIIATEPDNVDALATLAEHANEVNDFGHILQYTNKLIELLSGAKPADLPEADWKLRRERYLIPALWLNGITNSLRNNYAQADRALRAVLPYIRSNPQLLSTGLYHLGYVNYQLAEKGEPNRVFESLRFNQECAQIKSNYQEQAIKNIAAIKSEFNIP
jgi:tetratricopeptide (TPR) repeat protein